MSLTRRMLKAMGIEADAIDQIIEAHTETTDSLKAERDRYKMDADRVDALEEELEGAKRQLEEAKANNDVEELQAKYDKEHGELEKLRESVKTLKETNSTLKTEYDAYKTETEAKETKRAKTKAYRDLIDKAGISPKYAGAVLKVADLNSIEFLEDGTVKDADSIVEKVKGEYPEFVTKTSKKGAGTETPPTGNKTVDGAHDRALQIAKERHERLYGKSKE